MDSDRIVVNVVTLGCAKNLVDAEVMCGELAANGMLLTTDPEEADVVLVNTCAFIQDARREAEREIRAALRWKSRGRRAGLWRAVAVAGCLPQRDPGECARSHPGVDLFLGLDDVCRVHVLIRDLAAGRLQGRNVPAGSLPVYLYDEDTPRITVTPPGYAYLKIAEGCDHRCAFCAIPGIRGRLRSRTRGSVLKEVRNLLDRGCREIDLVAQDTTSYGRDLGDGTGLADLLRDCDALDGDFWIRVLYTHPRHMTDEILGLLARSRHVVPYLDMPLQHISDHVLADMRRGMGAGETRALMRKIRASYPELTVRTTLLVGFPGETEADFQELLAFVREFKFDRLGVFAFSPEEGTPALELAAAPVPRRVAERRRDAILKAQQAIALERNAALAGREATVLLEERTDSGGFTARLPSDAPEVDGLVHVRMRPEAPPGRPGEFLRVRITAAGEYDLEAEQL